MAERKMIYGDEIKEKIDPQVHYKYLTDYQMSLVESTVFYLVNDKKMEKIDVADLLKLSISRISHAYTNAVKKFHS